tara:strand:+ start:376 stop:546 length:171 start_codon:yes stop_codon:yes gene_type:complete
MSLTYFRHEIPKIDEIKYHISMEDRLKPLRFPGSGAKTSFVAGQQLTPGNSNGQIA